MPELDEVIGEPGCSNQAPGDVPLHAPGASASRLDLATFTAAVRRLVDCVQRDDSGQLVGQIYMGGNGGLLGNETLAAADQVRKLLEVL